MELKVGFICDRGLNPRRPVNQDRYLALPERGLFAVFDGVGGQKAGEVASQTAAETIEEALANTSAASSAELVRRAIQFANRDVFEMAESDPAYKTMATTVALVHIDNDRATIAHVGDSRVYRLEDGRLHRETIDHTDLDDDLRAGLISREQAGQQAGRNVINRALGVEAGVDVEVKTIRVRDGARFLICSDGIYRHLSDERIARVLSEFEDPQAAADELKRLVHADGADDNLTAVIVQAGRARRGQEVSVEADGLKQRGEESMSAGAAARFSGPARSRERAGRIQVDFGGRGGSNETWGEQKRRGEWESDRGRGYSAPPASGEGRPVTRIIMYVLLVLLLVSGAFYAGLRASDFLENRASEAAPSGELSRTLDAGREAFMRGDYAGARLQLNAVVERDPQNAEANYWLGRVQLGQREYAGAAQRFEQAAKLKPTMSDAYAQAAAAYEAAGERAKAVQMLQRYGEERRKEPGALQQ
ncbi:MAG TPA: protein phosphatase 2C domain-containing protein [Blastocatellia bacterium]|nr:protein phosphatase 2C domain-containing protein [Blastocatellia bacterium]